jgi:hypothetical protein
LQAFSVANGFLNTNLLFFVKMTDLAVLQSTNAIDAKPRDDGEMEEMMAKWDAENGVYDENGDDDDVEVLDPDELPRFDRTLVIPDESFDHVILGTSDLERSIEDFEQMTGVRPVFVVSHTGLGTKCARGMYPCTFPNCMDFVLE